MKESKECLENQQEDNVDEQEVIDKGFEQMELLIKSRCVQPPTASNVTVREIDKDQ
ncbi:MAG: hypothetical protein ACN4GW_11535 [Desulforhopalus sp.]